MKTQIAIYLAGSIKKGHELNHSYWGDEERELLKASLNQYKISFLNPALRSDNLSDQKSVFGRDMLQVFCSDIVFVDARDRRGLGVGAEMMWAKLNRIPVVTLAPKETHYHKSQTLLLGVPVSDWIHPFVESLSDKIVDNISEGAKWIQKVMTDDSIEIKGIEFIESAMKYYKKQQFETDEPMKELALQNESLNRRIQDLTVV